MQYLTFFTLVALLGCTGVSALTIPQRRAGGVITSCTRPNTAALTFDDGPYLYTKQIGDALSNAGAKGTFFVNGRNFECIYADENVDRLQYVYQQGHQVASHTWAHRDLATLSYDEIADEMDRVNVAVSKITGATPAFTRPPYGSTSDTLLQVAAAKGQTLVNWDFDTRDSAGATPSESKALYDDLISRRPPSVLSLAHETYETSVTDVLPYAIQQLQGAGYELVTVAECLGQGAYLSVEQPQERDSSWQC